MKPFYFLKLIIPVVILLGWNSNTFAQVTTFTYTGGVQSYTVPAGITGASVDMYGGKGGNSTNGNTGGGGGRVRCRMNLTPGEVLKIIVGGVGLNGAGSTNEPGGYPNSVGTGTFFTLGPSSSGGGGGGASEIGINDSTIANRVVVAGGGGGSGSDAPGDLGGAGGGTGVVNIIAGANGSTVGPEYAGTGGGTAGPGSGGTYSPYGTSSSGNASGRFGGASVNGGGGGGGGYYGGGGGVLGGGGGGSSYSNATYVVAGSTTHTAGYNLLGNGQVTLNLICNNVVAGTITGNVPICAGQTLTLSDPTGSPGGTWSSDNTGVATVNPVTGQVFSTGTAGTSDITYTVIGCTTVSTSVVLVVNPTPSPIGGSPLVCTGQVSLLAGSPGGGSWSSTNGSIATVDGLGNVTGNASGTTTISYTLPGTGCASTLQVTVAVGPKPITWSGTGEPTLCAGSTLLIFDTTTGGTWSSGFLPVATVVPTSGLVSGVQQGSATISYTIANSCFVSIQVSVNGLPAVNTVSTSVSGGHYCAGGTCPSVGLGGSQIGISYQLKVGSVPVGTGVLGTGLGLSFGPQCTVGTYSVIAINPVTGCSQNMLFTPSISVTVPPPISVVSGGGDYCASSGSGVSICVATTVVGVSYQLYNGTALSSFPQPGNGGTLCFIGVTDPGIYTVVATNSGGCSSTMTGSASVTIDPPPSIYNVFTPTLLGDGVYCSDGPGVLIDLSFSTVGVSYQLSKDASPVGAAIAGTGDTISFGYQTLDGTYTVVATNTTTLCTSNMAGSINVSTVPMPGTHTITLTDPISGLPITGSSYCADGPGIDVGLDGSEFGVNYQLYRGTTAVGGPVAGTTAALDFGAQTIAGTYRVVASNATYGCTDTMAGTTSITINGLPAIFNVTGGGSYCLVGGSGDHILLSGSQIGVTYTLNLGFSSVGSKLGTGGPLDFGVYTGAGTYTVVGTNGSGCSNTMSGSASITINPPPPLFNITGGGNYCSGSGGVHIGLDVSSIGVTYQLMRGPLPIGVPLAGTGASLDFGLFTIAGTYTITGTNTSTTCSAVMNGAVTIGILALPNPHNVTGGGPYCIGGIGVPVNLSGSDAGISYQLYDGVTPVGGAMAGTGLPLSFGLQTAAGVYTIIATDTTTSCTKTMTNVDVVIINPLPTPFTVTGGGIYCNGGGGSHIGLSGSNGGVHYLLYNGTVFVDSVTGSGFAIDFGAQTAPGVYTVVASNTGTGCNNNMLGSALIMISPLPTVHTVTGGGNFCDGSTTFPSVGLDGSDASVNYQLYRGGVAVGTAVAGTGGSLDFGIQSAPGIYTVVATDAIAGCTKDMGGSATITINPLPAVFTVLGGGNYCVGGTGFHVYLGTSAPGVNYQLMMGADLIGGLVPGTGAGIDMGLQTAAGTYTIVGSTAGTGCSNNMTGSATINVNPLPVIHTVVVPDGSNYCVTTSGVHIGLDGSETGIHYQLFDGATALGAAVSGTGSALNFGIHAAGTYTIVASNPATSCTSTMGGSAVLNAVPLPNVYAVTGGGFYCETGFGVHVGVSGSDSGTSYQLYYSSSPTGVPVIATGSSVDFGLETATGTYTVMASNGVSGCNSNMSGSAVVTRNAVIVPVVNVTADRGDTVCIGQLTTFTASPINGGPSPVYKWMVNGTVFGTGSAYSYIPIDGDVVTALLTSNATCAIPDTATKSVRMTVSPQEMPAVNVSANPGDIICQGSPVIFTATPSFGGSAPGITWVKNGVTVATSGLTYSYTPANHDIIVVQMSSNFPCRLADNVFSNTNSMDVEPPVIPTVGITSNPGTNIAAGQSVTFTATVAHGGPNPSYQWLVNGLAVHGATSPTYTNAALSNGDSVTCEVVGGCALTGFNSVIVHVANVGVQQVAAGSGDIILVPNPNKGVFTLKGTLGTASNEEVSVEVTNMLGQVVYSSKVMTQNGAINEKVQLSSALANGMYILNLRSGSQNNIFHFVIEQ